MWSGTVGRRTGVAARDAWGRRTSIPRTGVGLAQVKDLLERVLKDLLERVLAGEFSVTAPEMELLARRLRGVGVEVAVSGQAARRCSG
ncbi:hypothetical protein [Streptomyces justiciae]|uniref:hypothetical protein n=1 Tax=Streptomyces justiciae TaxID=2780140 RepID=UPI0021182895|nr:hypothetical protein [Streptomyces justiciae]MCW8379946.1 hypothetical protein [Streptomyces justiciae]